MVNELHQNRFGLYYIKTDANNLRQSGCFNICDYCNELVIDKAYVVPLSGSMNCPNCKSFCIDERDVDEDDKQYQEEFLPYWKQRFGIK